MMMMNEHKNFEYQNLKLDNNYFQKMIETTTVFSLTAYFKNDRLPFLFNQFEIWIKRNILDSPQIEPELFFSVYRMILRQTVESGLVARIDWMKTNDRLKLKQMIEKSFDFNFEIHLNECASETEKEIIQNTYKVVTDLFCSQLLDLDFIEMQICYMLFFIVFAPGNFEKIASMVMQAHTSEEKEIIADHLMENQIIPFLNRAKSYYIFMC